MASENVERIFQLLNSMDRLELAGFRDRAYEEYGIVQPGQVVQPATKTVAVEEKTSFTVTLTKIPDTTAKIRVLKVVRAATGLDLKGAKELVDLVTPNVSGDGVPQIVTEDLSQAQAEALVAELQEAGGDAEIS